MSISQMMSDAANAESRKQFAKSGRLPRRMRSKRANQAETIAAGLARYIPAEAVALYTAILPFLGSQEPCI